MAIYCNCHLTRLAGKDARCPHFDMTDLQRVTITDSMTDKEKALFQSYNDNCEAVEDLWIELDLQAMDQMEQAEKKLRKRNMKQKRDDDREGVLQLHKQGFTLAEIASITKLEHKAIYDYIHSKTKKSDLFEECPEEILKDLGEVFDF